MEEGFPGAEISETWLAKMVALYRSIGHCVGPNGERAARGSPRDPYGAYEEHRFRISLVLKTIENWVAGPPEYRAMRLLASCVAGAGNFFAIHFLTDLVRVKLGFDGAVRVYAPTGIAALQVGVGWPPPPPTPKGEKALGHLYALKGDGIRQPQGNLDRRALLIGDERGAIGRSMIGWKQYRDGLAPLPSRGESSASWGGRPVADLLGDDLQLPPALATPCHDRSSRGPAANHGLIVHDRFKDAVALSEIERQGAGDEDLRGVLTRLRAYSLTEGAADWMMALQLGKFPKGQKDWVDRTAFISSVPKRRSGAGTGRSPECSATRGAPGRKRCGEE